MPDRPDEPIIAFDALSLRVRSEFGRSAFGQQAGAYAFGLAVMHTELFAGHQDANRIHAFTLEGQHTRTIRGEWSAPQDLCSINERLFLAATAATAAEAGSSEAGAIFEIGADGRVLQTFQHQAMLGIAMAKFGGLLIASLSPPHARRGAQQRLIALQGAS
ncbi:hypothetical protein EMIHUDRAFT_432081 [Emiliania huxleyi CCMP1516]|uniref:Uncharacterized protein n=2 Tax=Emiliania huxleyi TaxID=2903 RepID=A0A0D3JHD5_EMIH1|nr:hypothetical protein EMIHUDRAFT_432081 [Emiliania huxleyi CCMP1516]EOD22920.1 hypothetical protein EMIHUDRAFT_432081 [Emiliania huxleyi CCMP1516]|eukprot:XP_005775349.1 hypothetical protein EMIHUDRAFT_432081 [Emiliania huxleyi CCMP1516]